MNVLITGASGTVGKNVIDQLLNINNIKITVFDLETKHTKSLYSKYKDTIDIIYGDITDHIDVQSIFKNKIDVVIHLAAIIPPLADENPFLAHQVNTLGTEHLITCIQNKSPDTFFLYASSVSVYGDRIHNPLIKINDTIKPSFGDEYAKTKIASEKLIMKSSINWSIFRLSAIMGINNHKISKLMFHMPLATSIEITTPEDTARAFVNAIDKQELISNKCVLHDCRV